MRGSKGVHTIVSTVLLIAVSVALVLIVYSWATKLIVAVLGSGSPIPLRLLKIEEVSYVVDNATLSIYLTPTVPKVRVVSVVVLNSEGRVICNVNVGRTVTKPYTRIDVTCRLGEDTYRVKVYTECGFTVERTFRVG